MNTTPAGQTFTEKVLSQYRPISMAQRNSRTLMDFTSQCFEGLETPTGNCFIQCARLILRGAASEFQKRYIIAKVTRKEDNYSVCIAVLRCLVFSEKQSCVICAIFMQLPSTCSSWIHPHSCLKSTDHVTNNEILLFDWCHQHSSDIHKNRS